MSQYLIDDMTANPNADVRVGTQVVVWRPMTASGLSSCAPGTAPNRWGCGRMPCSSGIRHRW
jgi:hypothetical protein